MMPPGYGGHPGMPPMQPGTGWALRVSVSIPREHDADKVVWGEVVVCAASNLTPGRYEPCSGCVSSGGGHGVSGCVFFGPVDPGCKRCPWLVLADPCRVHVSSLVQEHDPLGLGLAGTLPRRPRQPWPRLLRNILGWTNRSLQTYHFTRICCRGIEAQNAWPVRGVSPGHVGAIRCYTDPGSTRSQITKCSRARLFFSGLHFVRGRTRARASSPSPTAVQQLSYVSPPLPNALVLYMCVCWCVLVPEKPFTHEEHSAFLDAMERYGQENTGDEWDKISQVQDAVCMRMY